MNTQNKSNPMWMITVLSFLFVLVTIGMASCSKDGPEVVFQDASWQIDDEFIDEDIREQLGIDPFATLLYFDKKEYAIKGSYTSLEGESIIAEETLVLKVRLTSPAPKDLTVKLVYDKSLVVDSKQSAVPASSFTVEKSLVIPKGQIEVPFNVKLNKLTVIEDIENYVIPLSIVMDESIENIKLSTERASVLAVVQASFSNIDSSGNPIDGELFNENLIFSSSSNQNSLKYLQDELFREDLIWYPGGATTNLTISIPSKKEIKGILIHTSSAASYKFKTAEVSVLNEKGVLISNGVYLKETSLSGENKFYIKFITPVNTNKIILTKMYSQRNSPQPDFVELELIK